MRSFFVDLQALLRLWMKRISMRQFHRSDGSVAGGNPVGCYIEWMLHCGVVQHFEPLVATLQLQPPLSQALPKPDQRDANPTAGLTPRPQGECGEAVLVSLLAHKGQPLLCCTIYLNSIIHSTPYQLKKANQHANASLRMLEASALHR